MSDSTPRVPEPQSTDSSDVSDALDVAQSLWENAKHKDAIHWVKRAVDAAKSGDPSRHAFLTRAAEALERAIAPAPAATPPPVPVAVSRPPPPPVPRVSKPPPPVPTAKLSRPPPQIPVPTPAAPPVAKSISASVPVQTRAAPPPMKLPSDQTLRVRASVRVSVKTSVRDSGLLVVRPLADGAAVPPGTREALLTFVDDTDPSSGA